MRKKQERNPREGKQPEFGAGSAFRESWEKHCFLKEREILFRKRGSRAKKGGKVPGGHGRPDKYFPPPMWKSLWKRGKLFFTLFFHDPPFLFHRETWKGRRGRVSAFFSRKCGKIPKELGKNPERMKEGLEKRHLSVCCSEGVFRRKEGRVYRRALILVRISRTVSAKAGSLFSLDSICRMEYMMVVWSRPPKILPMSSWDRLVMERIR